MATKQLPDVETLRKLLEYDPATGVLTWKPRPVEMFPNAAKAKRWNTRYANKPAGNQRPPPKNYILVSVLAQNLMAHRIVWALHYGIPPAEQIDHINGNPADNRISNLRVVSNVENCRNQRAPRNNTSGHVGVHFRKKDARWYAYISARGRISLGDFQTFEEAVAARKAAEIEHGFHANHGRS